MNVGRLTGTKNLNIVLAPLIAVMLIIFCTVCRHKHGELAESDENEVSEDITQQVRDFIAEVEPALKQDSSFANIEMHYGGGRIVVTGLVNSLNDRDVLEKTVKFWPGEPGPPPVPVVIGVRIRPQPNPWQKEPGTMLLPDAAAEG